MTSDFPTDGVTGRSANAKPRSVSPGASRRDPPVPSSSPDPLRESNDAVRAATSRGTAGASLTPVILSISRIGAHVNEAEAVLRDVATIKSTQFALASTAAGTADDTPPGAVHEEYAELHRDVERLVSDALHRNPHSATASVFEVKVPGLAIREEIRLPRTFAPDSQAPPTLDSARDARAAASALSNDLIENNALQGALVEVRRKLGEVTAELRTQRGDGGASDPPDESGAASFAVTVAESLRGRPVTDVVGARLDPSRVLALLSDS